MRESERVREGEGREKGFSVFVLNIPRLLDKFGLYGIFRRAGRVCDTSPFKMTEKQENNMAL